MIPMVVQDTALQQHTERLQSAVDMARKLQRNEETTLKDRMEMVCTFRHNACACVCVFLCVCPGRPAAAFCTFNIQEEVYHDSS